MTPACFTDLLAVLTVQYAITVLSDSTITALGLVSVLDRYIYIYVHSFIWHYEFSNKKIIVAFKEHGFAENISSNFTPIL